MKKVILAFMVIVLAGGAGYAQSCITIKTIQP